MVKTHITRNSLWHGCCLEGMASLPANSVDVVFADPPYNLQLCRTLTRPDDSLVDGVAEDWDKFDDFAAYDNFSRAWLVQARRVLKPAGTIWVIGSYHNIFRLGTMLQNLGYWILNDVIWRKNNPMPNFRGRRFTNAHETLIWAAKSRQARKYVFNYHALKVANDDVQMRSDWYLPICSGKERLRGADGKKLHPTQKPEALLQRVLLASSKMGDVVLDPFAGSGTTAVVARRLRRQYIGMEKNADYVAAARQRIAATKPLTKASADIMPASLDAPRVPFLRLLESGMIKPGACVFDMARRYNARVRVDGSLSCAGQVGSIHSLSARLQNITSCNGWTFWHIARGKDCVPLSALREELRQTS